MATVVYVDLATPHPDFSRVAWFNMLADDVGSPLLTAGLEVQSVQTYGVFANGKIEFEGNNSNDSDQFVTIPLIDRNLTYFTDRLLDNRLINVYNIRPKVINGEALTNINVVVYLKKV